jgi:hypothetical protein
MLKWGKTKKGIGGVIHAGTAYEGKCYSAGCISAIPYKQDVRATLLQTGSIDRCTPSHTAEGESTAEQL